MDEYQPTILDHTFSALSHPARRRILELLASDEICVTDLAANFDCSLNVVSKHIQSLERAGLVRRSREGRVHRLRLEPTPLAAASAFIERYRDRWERQFDRLAKYLDKVAMEEERSARAKK
jgi:DNA-binding transcriptional ArsR family regulator